MENICSCRYRGSLLALGVSLALGLIVSSFIVTGALKEIRLSAQSLTVKGYAERKIVSDFALWRGTFAAADANLVVAFGKIESDLKKTLAYLERNGIKKD